MTKMKYYDSFSIELLQEMEAITLEHAKAISNLEMQEKSIKEKESEREGLEREKWNIDEEVETVNKKIK